MLLTFIKLPFVIEIFVLSNFDWPFYTGFTVPCKPSNLDVRWSTTPKALYGPYCMKTSALAGMLIHFSCSMHRNNPSTNKKAFIN